ncbi:hypothetical protein Q6348_02155 [Isoptericola sp. b441]|uniref:Tetratricopeptide repeat protein n=1 Tax=Actinotalea lenta TaxID=3064654 RepID=A0ABT9D5E0_9CELL|nr:MULTISPECIES: hypothetical protein [unclassified Isoptericola]MDO8105994.1 hypothetical protein [Isoptericola sp. b441]MDO8122287.1 hypothetical protein [Isoptericola sp. b490]
MTDVLPPAELRALWDFADPEGSEAVLRAAADGASTMPGRQAELLTQVARAMGLQGHLEDAHRVLDALEPVTHSVAVRVLLERGRLYRTEGRLAEAASTFEAAAVAAARAGLEVLQVDALHMLAVVDGDRGELWTRRALDVVAASADPETRRWAVALQNNRAWDLMSVGRTTQALAHFTAAHNAAVEVGTAEQERLTRWAVARCLRELGRVTEALEIQRVLAGEMPDSPYVAEEIAALEGLIGRTD